MEETPFCGHNPGKIGISEVGTALTGNGHILRHWGLQSGRVLKVIPDHEEMATAHTAISPDGRLGFTAGAKLQFL